MKQIGSSINKFRKALFIWCRVLFITLRDRRLPSTVRILIWFATIYLICPFDFKPDFLPGGFIDDEIITPILLLLAFFSIPKGVLTDAKLLANQAKYSFVCMAISSTGGSSELSILMPAAMGVSAQASIVYLCPLTRPKFEDIMSGHAQSVIKKHFNICDIKEINISNAFKLVKAKSKIAIIALEFFTQPHCKFTKIKEAFSRITPLPASHSRTAHRKHLQLYQTEDDPDSSTIYTCYYKSSGAVLYKGSPFYASFLSYAG